MTNCVSRISVSSAEQSPVFGDDKDFMGMLPKNAQKKSLFAVAKEYFFSLPMKTVQDKQECLGRQVYASMNCWSKILHCTKSYQEMGAKFMEEYPLSFVRVYLKVFPESLGQVVVPPPVATTRRESSVSHREENNLHVPGEEEREIDLLEEAQRNALQECAFVSQPKNEKLSRIEESNQKEPSARKSNLISKCLSSFGTIPPSILENKGNHNSHNNTQKREEKSDLPPKDLFAEVVEVSVECQGPIPFPSPVLSPGPLAIASAATIRQQNCLFSSPTLEENISKKS